MDSMSWSAFVIGAALIIVSPGPDFIYVMTQGVAGGRSSGVMSALGISLGLLTHTLLAAVGLTGLLTASPLAFEVVRSVGAVYLVYLGIKAFRSHTPVFAAPASGRVPSGSYRLVLRQGFLTNLLNPKALLTFLAFIPQFINRDSSSGPQILALGGTLALIALSWFGLVGFFAGSIGAWVGRSRLAQRTHWLTGAVLIGLGFRLVLV